MAKTAHKAKKGAAAKKAVRKAPAPPAAPKRVAGNKTSKREIPLDFTTARNLPEGDHRIPQGTQIVAFLVNDVDGNELVYHCLAGQVPAEARAALAAG